MKKNLLFISFLLLFPILIWTQDYTLDIQQFGVEDGLLHRNVITVFEDKVGFIWIGGKKGLQRYDGYEFKSWTKVNQTGQIFEITSIFQDDGGWLWLWNNKLKKFIFLHAETEEILSQEERFGANFPIQMKDYEKNYWANSSSNTPINSTGQLVFCLSRPAQLVTFDAQNGFDVINFNNITSLELRFIDSQDNIWAYVDQKRLVKMNSKGEELATYNLLENRNPGLFYEWDNKYYYTQVGSVYNEKLPDLHFAIDKNGIQKQIWKGKRNQVILNGIIWQWDKKNWKLYDANTKELAFAFTEKTHKKALFYGSPRPYADSKGRVWIFGPFGLNKLVIQSNRFQNYLAFPEGENKPFNNAARGIWVEQDNITVNFETSHTIRLKKKEPKTWTILNEEPWARPLLPKNKDEFWLGYSHYLKSLNKKGEITNNIPFTNNAMWAFYKDKNKNKRLWIGSSNGLFFKNEQESIIQELKLKEDPFGFSIRSPLVQNIIPNTANTVWLCSSRGLYLFDTHREIMLGRYASDEKGINYLPADLFYYVYQDQEGIYWIGTSDGLIRWKGPNADNPDNFKLFTRVNGLSNEVIYAIFEDNYNRLWMSSDYGIMSFDKTTFNIQTYLEKDGISHHEFNRTSQFQEEDGVIYFGSLNGITSFHPKDFGREEKNQPKMLISDFELFDGEEGKLINKVGALRQSKTIDFYPNDRFFRLKFVLPTFEDISQMLYAWKIEGIDEDWNYQKDNNLQLSLLPYGEHQLRIKGQSSDGNWSPHELTIQVNVHKPFYLKTWFICLALISLIAGVIAFFKLRTRVLKREIAKATKQIEEDKLTIQKQAEELLKLDELKSRFFANVSHELRTPLALMLGPIKRLLKNKEHSINDKKLLNFLQKNGLHLRNLVNEILDLSKLENNKMELEEEPVNFYAYLNERMSQFYSFGNSESIIFKANFPQDEQIHLFLDKKKFEKVINNYLSNAMKFTPPGGKVILSVVEKEVDFHLMVTDTGRGIHPNDLPYVFDRFYQSKVAGAPTEGGTGIGLSLCKELAELMNGKVWAESTLGVGSTFHFQFPIKLAPSPTTDKKIEANQIKDIIEIPQAAYSETHLDAGFNTSNFKGARILIAEDNADLRSYYKIILSDFQVITTEHGQAALDYLESNPERPDLIISDLMMPIMDGMQFLEKLKANDQWRNIPVIMLTAKANRQMKIKALRIGIDDYLTKPFDEEELLARIENLLDHSKSRGNIKEAEEASIVEPEKPSITEADQHWLETLEQRIIEHIDDSRFSMEFISDLMGLSRRQIQRKLKYLVGLTPKEYINEIRFHELRRLLQNGEIKSVNLAAQKCGYSNSNYFSQQFKKRFGKSPSEMME